jgi:hypothetical protein
MSLDDLPDWLPAWCSDHLGDAPADVLFQKQQHLEHISMVFGLRLAGGTDVVVKARAGDSRAQSCVAAQARLAERGFPCARPLTPVVGVGSLAVHAEEFRPGGEMLRGDSPDVAACYAEVFARLMAELAEVTVAPPLPNPPWARWDHTDPGVWPAIDCPGDQDQGVVPANADDAMPAYAADIAVRVRRRILAAGLPCVLGYADFEAQNLRWHGRQVWAVHDWDSLAWQPEAAPESPMIGLVGCDQRRGAAATARLSRRSARAGSPRDRCAGRTPRSCAAAPRAASPDAGR